MPAGGSLTLPFRTVAGPIALAVVQVVALTVAPASDAAGIAGSRDTFRPTPEQAVAFALAAHPALAEQRAVLDRQEARIAEAWSAVFPEVDLRASVVRNRDPGLLNSPNFNQFDELGFDPSFLQPIPVTTYDYRLAVDQLVYAFGKVSRAVEAARLAREADDLRLRGVRTAVARDVLVAYYDLAGAVARVEVVAAERRALEREVTRARDFLEIGAGTRLALLQAEAALAALRPRELDAEGAVRAGRARFNETLGRDPALAVDVVPGVLERDRIPPIPDLDGLVGAIDHRPRLVALARDGDVLSRLAELERAGTRPEFRVTGSAGVRAIETGSLGDDRFASWDVGFYVDWPLFDGRASRSRARRFEAERRETEARGVGLRHEMLHALVVAHEAYRRGAEAWSAADRAVEVALEARRVAEESSRWGAATTLDVLEAERTLSAARGDRVEAARAVLAAEAEIRYQIGRMPGEPWPDPAAGEGR